MNQQTIKKLKDFYTGELLNDVVPFWQNNSVDWEFGGFLDFLDRDGKPLSTDKGGWVQGRAVWVFSNLYRDIEQRDEWLKVAENGVDFIKKHLIRSSDGRVYFEVTRDGKPLVMRRYLFSEIFAAMGLAAYSEISGDKTVLKQAIELYKTVYDLFDKMPSKIDPDTRSFRGHSFTMMLINLNQVMREADPDNSEQYTKNIDKQIDELFRYFVKPDLKCLLETVDEDGGLTEGPEGRCVNPGHAIETAWFILEEAKLRGDKELIHKTLPIIDWSLDLGWDKEHGGIFSFIDIEGKQPAQVEWDMKYWWPHCETIYALLLAYELTEDKKYEEWFNRVHDYTWEKFPDRESGEWFGYLRRDGSVQVDLKGNHFKGPFHIPRFLTKVTVLLNEMEK